MICSGTYLFLTIYSPFYDIISGIVSGGQVKVTEKIISENRRRRLRKVIGIVPFGGDRVTIGRTFELVFNLTI
jgi:hypothetical protein